MMTMTEQLTDLLIGALILIFGYTLGIAKVLKTEKALLEAENEHLREENEMLKVANAALQRRAVELFTELQQRELRRWY
jgi:cell division protein FtsB